MLSADPRKLGIRPSSWSLTIIKFVLWTWLRLHTTVGSCQYLAFLRNWDSQNQDIPAYHDHKKLEYGD